MLYIDKFTERRGNHLPVLYNVAVTTTEQHQNILLIENAEYLMVNIGQISFFLLYIRQAP